MAIYKNFTGNTTNTDLIVKSGSYGGGITEISITCTHDSVDLIVDRLYIDDGSTEYDIIANVKIPVGAALILDNNIAFDVNRFGLKITTTNSSNCSIIIK